MHAHFLLHASSGVSDNWVAIALHKLTKWRVISQSGSPLALFNNSTEKGLLMPRALAKKNDAVDLLDADHVAVKKLFENYRKLCESDASSDEKLGIAEQICQELKVHAQIEEEIFYPALRDAIDDDLLLDEAAVEHSSAKELIAQITEMSPEDDLYDARVTVLGEYIDHHVKEEREQIFVKARKSKVDLVSMAQELSQRKMELMEEMKSEA
jgi:hemerythrin superfamily protein